MTYANANAIKTEEATNGIKQIHEKLNGTKRNARPLPAICDSAEEFLEHDYDFLIVGGGTAGLVLAARLTEDPNVTVGVLEAGKNRLNDPMVDTPAAFFRMLGDPEYDWRHMTEPQKGFSNLGGSVKHHLVRAKMLGGCSGINYMLWVVGSDQDYDDWATIVEDDQWNAASLKPYFRKITSLQPYEVEDRSNMPLQLENHGTDGPIKTGFNDATVPCEEAFIRGCDEVTGLGKPKDPFNGDHLGFISTMGTVARSGANRGKRSYAARDYFEPNAGRPNLHVLCEAMVHRVDMDGDTATGITFEHAGQKHTAIANKEVIVSCGVLQTPQILELSGVGDPEVLKAAGVDCKVANEAVGRNLVDHIISGYGWQLKEGWQTLDSIQKPERMAAAQKAYLQTKGGPMSNVSSTQGFFPYKQFASVEQQKFIHDSIAAQPGATPFQQKQYAAVASQLKSDSSASMQLLQISSTVNWAVGPMDQVDLFKKPKQISALQGMSTIVCLQYPLSRGTVHIRSSDPHEHPCIDARFGTHPADVQLLTSGLNMCRKLEQSEAFAPLVNARVFPPPEADMDDPEVQKKWAGDWLCSEYHSCGTCAMGDALDTDLKVKGAKRLRVVDASVFPNQISGNIQATVYAVAEKAADMIKAEYGLAN